VHQPIAHDFRTDRRRANRFDAEFAIQLPARGVVDACDDFLDAEHALGDERRHDVSVIAVGYGNEAIGFTSAGSQQHVVIDTRSNFHPAVEVSAETLESGWIFVDDDDIVSFGGE